MKKNLFNGLRHLAHSRRGLASRGGATMLEGKVVSAKILEQVARDMEWLRSEKGVTPKLVPVVVGQVPESEVYVKRKVAAAQKHGLHCDVLRLPDTIDQAGLLDHISVLNRDPDVHGVIVQLPLPLHLNEEVVCNAVDVTKDVDGFTTTNLGSLVQGVSLGRSFVPCTPLAVLKILQTSVDIPFKGLSAVVAGRSHNVGLPIAIILAADAIKGGLDMSTTVCHRYTPPDQLAEAVSRADVVVSAAGVPNLITKDIVKPGACVIDVGINRVRISGQKSKIVGDVSPDVSQVAGWMTPVPGGVGPCTVACLMYNTVLAAKYQSTGI